jgi:hypothetical protein
VSNRETILQTILNDPTSTEAEIRAARKELKQSEVTSDEDAVLEHYLANRNLPGQQLERREWRRSLTPDMQELLDDITVPSSLMIIPDAGTEGRLTALLKRTKSGTVIRHASAALTNVRWMQSMKESTEPKGAHATTFS